MHRELSVATAARDDRMDDVHALRDVVTVERFGQIARREAALAIGSSEARAVSLGTRGVHRAVGETLTEEMLRNVLSDNRTTPTVRSRITDVSVRVSIELQESVLGLIVTAMIARRSTVIGTPLDRSVGISVMTGRVAASRVIVLRDLRDQTSAKLRR
jgi:hypothetical protein